MKNRYDIEYNFEKISDNVYHMVGNFKYWRYGGQEGQERVNYSDLGFADPEGGPFISLGYLIEGKRVDNIELDENNRLLLKVIE